MHTLSTGYAQVYPQGWLHSLLNREMLENLRVRIVIILWVFVLSRGFGLACA